MINGAGLQPSVLDRTRILGRCPRLGWNGPFALRCSRKPIPLEPSPLGIDPWAGLSALGSVSGTIPGALAQAGMEWAVGPLEGQRRRCAGPRWRHCPGRTEIRIAPTAHHHPSLGQRPRKPFAKKPPGLKARSIFIVFDPPHLQSEVTHCHISLTICEIHAICGFPPSDPWFPPLP